MVMKNKLVKFNRKSTYYKLRKAGLSILISCSAFFIVMVPTYISISYRNESGHATKIDDSSSSNSDIEDSKDEIISYSEN